KLLKLDENEYVLVSVIDHTICDGVSRGILQRDLWTLYAESLTGLPPSLPDVQIQFADFADWQYESRTAWNRKHGDYWRRRLAGAERVRIFPHAEGAGGEVGRMAFLEMRLGGRTSDMLSELAQQQRTLPPIVAISGYASVLFCWCDSSDL